MLLAVCSLAACGKNGDGGKNDGNDTAQDSTPVIEQAAAGNVGVQQAAVSDSPAYGGEAVFSMRLPTTLNPLKNNDKTVDLALSLVFAPLVVLDDAQKPAANPAIAESMTFSDDGLTAFIAIKEGAAWHDGEGVTARDVKYTVDVLRTAQGTLYDGRAANILTCEAINEKTVKFTFAQVFSCQGYELAFPIIPRHIYEKKAETDPAQMAPVGCGAYKFASYSVTDGLRLVVNEAYEPKPYIESVRFLNARDEQAGRDMFDSGETDALFAFMSDGGKYKSGEKYRTQVYTTNYFDFLGFNCETFTANERKALASAVPFERILAQAYIGGIEAAAFPINPKSRLSGQGAAYRYDTAAAKAAYGGKKSAELLINAENTERERAADMIKESFEVAGVTVTIVKLPFEEYKARIDSLEYDMFLGGITAPDEPLFDYMLSGANMFGYANEHTETLLANIFNAETDSKLTAACRALQEYMADELPFYGLGFRESVFAVSSRIGGDITPGVNSPLNGFEGWYIRNR